MQSRKWYGRDTSLQLRMALTIFLLFLTFMVFGVVLFAFTRIAAFLVIIPLIGIVIQYFASDKLVLATTGAHVVTPQQQPELHAIVERLAQLADLPKPRVAVVETQMPNAFATGRNPKHALVAVTTGLMERLTRPELEAVLAHEMTHIRNRDMTVMTMASSLLAMASFLTQMLLWMGMWGGLDEGGGDNRDSGAFGIVLVLVVSAITWFVSYVLINALSRYREYAADRGGAILTGSPENLVSALTRISGDMARVPTQDLRRAQPMSALYIAAPRKNIMTEIFADHPSLQHRVDALQKLQQQMAAA